MPEKNPPQTILYSRKTTAAALDTSVDTVKELERQGVLSRIRLTGPRGDVHHPASEVMALAEKGVKLPAPTDSNVTPLRKPKRRGALKEGNRVRR